MFFHRQDCAEWGVAESPYIVQYIPAGNLQLKNVLNILNTNTEEEICQPELAKRVAAWESKSILSGFFTFLLPVLCL